MDESKPPKKQNWVFRETETANYGTPATATCLWRRTAISIPANAATENVEYVHKEAAQWEHAENERERESNRQTDQWEQIQLFY